jgi:hypothetical protein
MDPITKQSYTPQQIQEYQSYFKRLNLKQYGAGILLDALNQGEKNTDLFGDTTNTQAEEAILPQTPSLLNINPANIYQKIWKDLEGEIKAYERAHPEVKGKYVVALNADTADGQPIFKVAGKADVLKNVGEQDKEASDALITDYPVQVFQSKNLDVSTLPGAGQTGLEKLVEGFLAKNKGVFTFLLNQSPAPDETSTVYGT